jgi:heme oxygenase
VPLTPPALGTRAAQWGAAYVIEGSRLGGALLARSVPVDRPRSYLGSASLPGSWRKFLEKLDKALSLPQDIADATESARATFSLFEQAGLRVRGATD